VRLVAAVEAATETYLVLLELALPEAP